MAKMIRKRLVSLVIILFGLSVLTFGLTYLLPSDPVEELITSMGGSHDPETIAKLEEQYGTSRPFLVQYADWIKGVVLHGDFGISVKYNKPVKEVIAQKLPNTVKLACTSFLTMILISFPLGILSAVYKDRIADYIIRFLSFIGVSMPSFWFGMLMIWIFAVRLGWLPVITTDNVALSLVLPTLTLAISMASKYTRQVRATVLEELNKDYVIGARARGVRGSVIIWRNVMKSSMLTIITLLALSIGNLLGGTTIVETIFMWDGVGKMAVDAITMRDYPIIQAYVAWMAIIYVVVNLITDIIYHYLDPRVRLGGDRA